MKFKIKDNTDPRILEDLGFTFYSKKGWVYTNDRTCKITLQNDNLSVPLIIYYLIKLDLVEII